MRAEKIEDAVEKMKAVEQGGIVRANRMTRTDLSLLVKARHLHPIVRGWYFVAASAASAPGSLPWYKDYWSFLRQYIEDRFGDDYCLLPEDSLRLLTGVMTVPLQLVLMRKKPGKLRITLPLGTSLFIYQDRLNFPKQTAVVNGIRVMEWADALPLVHEAYFRSSPEEAARALRWTGADPARFLRALSEKGCGVVAGRLAGAFRHVGEEETANRILESLRGADPEVREQNPFDSSPASAVTDEYSTSPCIAWRRALWAKFPRVAAALSLSENS